MKKLPIGELGAVTQSETGQKVVSVELGRLLQGVQREQATSHGQTENLLVTALLGGMFGKHELSEDDLRELRQRDVLTELIKELARDLPVLKRVLIDERDAYLAQKIRDSSGERIVAVVGAGHLDGVEKILIDGSEEDLAEIE